MCASIYTHHSQATYRCGVQHEDSFRSVDTRAGSAGQTRGSREKVSRFEVTRPTTDPYLTGQSESSGSSRVGSGGVQNFTGQAGSGQSGFLISRVGSGRVGSGGFQISRVGSGRVRRLPKSRGSGWVSPVFFCSSTFEHSPTIGRGEPF